MNSEGYSKKSSPLQLPPARLSKRRSAIGAALAFLGFADAAFLTAKHYAGVIPPCSFFEGCEIVTGSAYATISGVPISLLGTLSYLTILLLSLAFLDTKKHQLIFGAALLSSINFLVTLVLLYLQAFVLKAYCIYCLASALTSVLLFVNFFGVLKLRRTNNGPYESGQTKLP